MTTKESIQEPVVQSVATATVVDGSPQRAAQPTFLERPLLALVNFNWETTAWIVLLVVAAVLRFVNVGERAMSHDESLHTLYSYYLYDTGKYEHNPMMHGPILYHLNALAYFLFGDNDASARFFPVLAGIGVVGMAWLFRRYIGRTGALVAGVLITISPSLLFHSRYIRHDMYIALFLLVWIYGSFRYMDTRERKWLSLIMIGMSLGLLAMEAHFISGAILGAFFVGLALWRVIGQRLWLAVAPLSIAGGIWYLFHVEARDVGKQAETAGEQAAELLQRSTRLELTGVAALAVAALIALGLLYRYIKREQWQQLRQDVHVDLAVLMLTLVMPFLAPFFLPLLGWELKAKFDNIGAWTTGEIATATFLVLLLTAIAVGIAYFWYQMRLPVSTGSEEAPAEKGSARPALDFITWAQLMGAFWVINILFYTTFLTNLRNGLATGIVGSLGYWLAQQEVARGGQPSYYYLMLASLYEFLPWLLSIVGAVVIVYWLTRHRDWDPVAGPDLPAELAVSTRLGQSELLRQNRVYFAVFCIWWTAAAWIAYTVAGEKMPWLLTHIALPMCILGGWWFGRLWHRIDWAKVREQKAFWLIGITPALLFALLTLLGITPSTDRSVSALAGTMQRILGLLIVVGLLYLIWRWALRLSWLTTARLLSMGFVAVLFLLTIRFSYMLTYINFDMATEYLVYAHASPDIKRALNEIDSISERTVGGRNIVVAYDDDSSWPLSWYMRLYPNHKFYGSAPSSDSMAAPVIIVGPKNYEKVHPYVTRDYVKRTYRLVWWPDMDYFNMTWGRLWNAVTDSQQRERIFQIFFYRRYRDTNDYSKFRDLSQWPHRHEFEMWVRRDLATQIWDLGVAPLVDTSNTMDAQVRDREVDQSALAMYNGTYGDRPLLTPRALAIAPDGSRVIADTGNNRIVVLDRDGNFVRAFGSGCRLGEGEAGGCQDPDGNGPLALGDGQFYEPWGVATDALGQIFVSDTWNGRIQVFDAEGRFVTKWGAFSSTGGELTDAFALFGPRGLAMGADGNLLVADTGNKRIIKFTPDGQLVQQIGGGGVIGGRFEEPVGIAVSPVDGTIFVADTWNHRIQKLSPALEFIAEWPVPGWASQDIVAKPYLAVATNGDVYTTDPQLYRVLVYNQNGEIKASFGNFGTDLNKFDLPTGIAVDPATNVVVVADANNNRILSFQPLP
ncbi:MAG: TIGR03663 family protein [Caldilineaceae bacterium]|nr:TIGR03663 family protein [Caldilineaceae bacterium]